MLHQIAFGLLLGWGVAIPMGPVNFEIIRRNLRLGTLYGIALGLGACCADVTYLTLLSLSTLVVLTHPITLKVVGILGSLILAWFGISALRMKSAGPQEKTSIKHYPAWRHLIEGYFMTLLSPFTILLWASLSTQVAIFAHKTGGSILLTAIGVFLGTLSWMSALNIFLHFTRHRLPARAVHLLNRLGGIILLGYAVYGLARVVI